ncbi:MAG: hypothetical protein IKB10_00305 [Alphaproteobacteria bacterium]|nr:hypothetical protein [Alphaproteobacteria bacterium]
MNKITYFGDGQSTDFAFSFNFFQKSDIYIEINGIPQTSGYTLTCINSTKPADIPYIGGTITFDIPPKSTDSITIYRKIEMSRVVDYQPMVQLDPDTLNQDANYLMEIIKDRKDEIDELYEQYSDIADKESTSVLLARIDTLNQQIENLERDIQNGKVMSKDDFYSHAANCITCIPQDIKLELTGGTLTLKSGSKVHLANGNLEGINAIATDISATQSNDGQYVVIQNAADSLYMAKTRSCLSGTIANRPETLQDTAGLYFATDENKMYLTGDAGNSWYSGAEYSLPLGVITVSNGAISSINQIFNGIGYIGSTVFILTGVKGLIPNGRNADGTLKNINVTIQSVLTKTIPSNTGWHYVSINSNGTAFEFATNFYTGAKLPSSTTSYSRFYNTDENRVYVVVNGMMTSVATLVPSFRIECEESNRFKISSIQAINVFHAAAYNNTEFIAHQSMPSDRYIDLTLGASGTTYTAPADGYFTISKQAGASGEYLYILNTSNDMNSGVISSSALNCRCFLPVSKNDNITINYTLSGTTNCFRFVYTNGAK